MSPKLHLQQFVGRLAIFCGFIYFLVLLGAIVGQINGHFRGADNPWIAWPTLFAPAAPIGVAVADGVRIHLTKDADRLDKLWRRCAMYGVVGAVLLGVTIYAIGRMGVHAQ